MVPNDGATQQPPQFSVEPDDLHAGAIDALLARIDRGDAVTSAEAAQLAQALRATRRALQADEERLALAQAGAAAGIWDWEPATDSLQWTPQLEQLYALPSGTVKVYTDWAARTHPDDIARVEAERDAALAERRPFDMEFRIVLPDGTTRWLAARGQGFYDAAGQLTRVVGINQDIDARKRVEIAQQAADARIRAQWESTPVASFIWKLIDGQFVLVEVNPAAERLSRGKAHDFVGMTAEQIYPDRPDMLACFRACMGEQGVIRHTTDYQARGTGRQRAIDFTFAFLPPDGILLHAQDLTEFRRAEEDLRFTQTVVDRMGDATYWAVEDGSLVYVNAAACAQLGYSRTELLALPITEIIAGASPAYWQTRWQGLKQQGALRFETGHVRKDGTVMPVDVQVSLIQVGGKEYACGIARDISERRAMEGELRASEQKFASLFAFSPVGMAITRSEDGIFLDANRAFLELAGYSRPDLIGHTALELNLYANPANRAAVIAAIERDGQVMGWPATMRRKDGSTTSCLLSMTGLEINGVPCYLAGIVHVGPLHQAEAALRAQQADMLALLENTDSLIWSIDAEYRLTACNSVYRRLVSAALGQEPVIGASVFTAAQAANIEEWRVLYDRALAGEPFAVELQRQIEGQLRWMECRFSPVRTADGEVSGVTVLGRDITESRQTARQIEEQLAEITFYFDTAPAGLAVLDTDLRYLRINKLLAAMNGIPVEEHIGRTVAEVVPLLADQARQIVAQILATGEPVTDIEIVGETAADSGVPHTWREHWYPIKHSDGTISGFNVTAEDITERKSTQARLERSEQNLAHAQKLGRLGNWMWDVRHDRLTCSDELYRIFGVGKEFDLTLANIEAMIYPDDRPPHDNLMMKDALAAGHEAEFEFRIIRPDGKTRHLYQYATIARDETGAPTELFGIIQDITERKLAETALRHRERNLNAAERIGQSGSWEDDLVADRAIWSDNMYRLFDVDPELPGEGFLGRFHQTLVHPDDRARAQLAYEESTGGGQPYDVEYRVIRKDGRIRHIHAIASVVRDDAGRAQRLLGWVQDITEQKQAAAEREQLQAQLAQAQKMETVGRLAGGIAHDFNNMLAVIMLRTELALQMVPADTPLHRSLTTVYTTAQRSAHLVQQLLGFARRQMIAPKVLDLNAAVDGLLSMLDKLIGEEVTLDWQPGPDLWPVKMDSAQVDQILTNLCVNARDAMGAHGIISIRTANATLAGIAHDDGQPTSSADYVLLSVSDTGSGIATDLLEHIFEPFFTTKGVGKGTGLGLATVDGIVQQNRGYIQVSSAPNAGATFAIYLPRFADPAATPAMPSLPALVRGEGRTVLLVEDEAVVLEMASEVLRALGYTVIAATTPGAALRVAEDAAATIDVLITDVIMPEMNGVLLARRVAQHRPALKTLFVSGYPADFMANRGLLASDAQFLAKPFTMQSLAAKVAEVLGAST